MALNTITPSNREEQYLSAIAGDAGASAPTPSNRHEEWLRRIAKHGESIPTVPEAGDNGKLWTAGSTGSASWETLSVDEVPTPGSGDNGKVLTAGAGGTYSWQTPAGSSPVVVYTTTKPQTYTDLNPPAAGLHWADNPEPAQDMSVQAVSLEPDGDPLTATELNTLIKNNTLIILDLHPGSGDYTNAPALLCTASNVEDYTAAARAKTGVKSFGATLAAYFMAFPEPRTYFGVAAKSEIDT